MIDSSLNGLILVFFFTMIKWTLGFSSVFTKKARRSGHCRPDSVLDFHTTGPAFTVDYEGMVHFLSNCLNVLFHMFFQRMRTNQEPFFSHTQRVSVTLAITLCPSSASSLSSLSSLSSSAWTFLVFRLLLSNRCTDLLQILCGCSLGGPLLSLLKSGCYPYFSWNYG